MKSEKVIVFDVDGTLFDTKVGIISAINQVLAEFGYPEICKNFEDRWIGPSIRDSFKQFALMDAVMAEEATLRYRDVYIENFILQSSMYDGLIDVLDFLYKKNFHLCIATMKTMKQILKLFSLFNLGHFFENIQAAQDNGMLKKKDMLKSIREIYSDKFEFVMVGDTVSDFDAAKENLFDFVFANYGYGKTKPVGDFICINSLMDIIKVV